MAEHTDRKKQTKYTDDTMKVALQMIADGKAIRDVSAATDVNINTLWAWQGLMKKPGTRPARIADQMQGVLRIEVTAAEKATAFQTFQRRVDAMRPSEDPAEKGRLAILALKFA